MKTQNSAMVVCVCGLSHSSLESMIIPALNSVSC